MNLHLLPKFLSRSCNVYVQGITGVFGLNTCCVGNHGTVACFPELLSWFFKKKISIQSQATVGNILTYSVQLIVIYRLFSLQLNFL